MFNLKNIQTIITQIENEKGLSRDVSIAAIEAALATAYKREYSNGRQEIRAQFNQDTGEVLFFQVKKVFDVAVENEKPEEEREEFNEEKHILLDSAKLLKNNVAVGDEVSFPLESGDISFGRIATQAAKQTLSFYFKSAERKAVMDEYTNAAQSIVTGSVRRFERGNMFVDLGKTVAIMPFYEQVRREHFKIGDRVRALVVSVDGHARRGSFVTLSRSNPDFVKKLFEQESPELANESVVVKGIARNPGFCTKIAITSVIEGLDPIGTLVGQRGVRVLMVRNELQGEQIDVVEWSENDETYIEQALAPVSALTVTLDKKTNRATVRVSAESIPTITSYDGQHIRLVSQLTGWDLSVLSHDGTPLASTHNDEVTIHTEREERGPSEEGYGPPKEDRRHPGQGRSRNMKTLQRS